MDQYELRPRASTKPSQKPSNIPPAGITSADIPSEVQDATPTDIHRADAQGPDDERQANLPPAVDPLLRTLATLQRQQREQTHLLRQLLAEVALLKAAQSQQSSTVTKLDRRMRWARVWRLSWLLIRIVLFVGIIWFFVYLIGVEQIQAMWARLVWLFT